jgi:hypothetical protein
MLSAALGPRSKGGTEVVVVCIEASQGGALIETAEGKRVPQGQTMSANGFDYDVMVIGSGFGGSVAAMRVRSQPTRPRTRSVGVEGRTRKVHLRCDDAGVGDSTGHMPALPLVQQRVKSHLPNPA